MGGKDRIGGTFANTKAISHIKGKEGGAKAHTNMEAKTIKASTGKDATVTDLSIGDKVPNDRGKYPAVRKQRAKE